MRRKRIKLTTHYAIVTTTDVHGNKHTWRMSGLPAFNDEAMLRRRALKRHWIGYGTPFELITVTIHGWESTVTTEPSRHRRDYHDA